MNNNQASTIIFILSIIVSFSGVVTGLVPPAYAALVVAVFGVISEGINFLKSGYGPPAPQVEGA
jgi:hypothetical protein